MTLKNQLHWRINSARLKQDFDELAEIGATITNGVTRVALSNEDLEARAWFANKIEEAGLIIHDDEVGNLSGVLPCINPQAKTFLIGSHLDTVPNGGRYDGSIGVLAGLECLRVLKEADMIPPVHLEVISFTDEEGWWQSFFGSMGLTGALEERHINDANQDNAAFRAALFRAGIHHSEVYKARRHPDSILGYLELHIEQSERLAKAHHAIGVVTGIVGRSVYHIHFQGEASHAATTAPHKRKDALKAAAVFITESHAMMNDDYPDGVFNCGDLSVKPATVSVVPSDVRVVVECRHPEQRGLTQMEGDMSQLAQACATRFGITVRVQRFLHRPAVTMSEPFLQAIESVCQHYQYPAMRLVSYAGHDVQILSTFTPSAMIFIPSIDGISHNPREYSTWESVEIGATVLLHTLLRLIGL